MSDSDSNKKFLGYLKPAYVREKRGHLVFCGITAQHDSKDETMLGSKTLEDQILQVVNNIELCLLMKNISVNEIFEITLTFKEGGVDPILLMPLEKLLNGNQSVKRLAYVKPHDLPDGVLLRADFKARKK